MSKITKENTEGFTERVIDTALSQFKFKFLIIFFMVMAIVPILSISEIRKGNSPLSIAIFIAWLFIFYKFSRSLHDKSIVSYWASLPCAFLVIFASFFY